MQTIDRIHMLLVSQRHKFCFAIMTWLAVEESWDNSCSEIKSTEFSCKKKWTITIGSANKTIPAETKNLGKLSYSILDTQIPLSVQ